MLPQKINKSESSASEIPSRTKHDVAGTAFADGPGPGAAAGGQESPEEAQGEGKRQRRPQTTAQHVRQGEPGVAATQSLVYAVSFVYSPNTPHITRPDLHGCFFKRAFFLRATTFVLHLTVCLLQKFSRIQSI